MLSSIYAWVIFRSLDQCTASSVPDDASVALLQLRQLEGKRTPFGYSLDGARERPSPWKKSEEEKRVEHLALGAVDSKLRKLRPFGAPWMANCARSKWIFIWTLGRAGSTTILSMLNHLPGVYLSGENNAVAEYLGQLRSRTLDLTKRGTSKSKNQAWFNDPRKGRLSKLARMWICALREDVPNSANTEYRGFKELAPRSYTQIKVVRDLFPGAYHVLNFRNDVKAHSLSGWYNTKAFRERRKEDPEQYLKENLVKMRQALDGAKVFELPMEEFSTARFNSLIDWLGMSTKCKFEYVLHQNDAAQGGYDEDITDPVSCSK